VELRKEKNRGQTRIAALMGLRGQDVSPNGAAGTFSQPAAGFHDIQALALNNRACSTVGMSIAANNDQLL
jgi:hypothetical protein